MKCIDQNETIFYNSNAIDKCYEQCPIECNSVQYELSTSFAYYPTYWYESQMLNSSLVNNILDLNSVNASYALLDSSILMVNVYYDEMFYTVVDDKAEMTVEYLIA